MSDMSLNTIKNLFEQQIKAVTLETVGVSNAPSKASSVVHTHAQLFDFQMSGGWV